MILMEVVQKLKDLGATLPPEAIEVLRSTHPSKGNAMCSAHSEGMMCCVDYIIEGAATMSTPIETAIQK